MHTYRTALVTGGAGFIGSHLVDALVERGLRVVVVDIATPKDDIKNSKAEYVKFDIREKGLLGVFMEHLPDVVFHLAAHIDDRVSVTDPALDAKQNILGSINVFECAKESKVKKLLFASTSVVYGNAAKPPFTEKTVPKPMTPYAISKLTGERYLNFYFHQYGIPYVALRIGNVYGPRQDGSKESGAVAIFTNKLLANEPPFMNDDGLTVRDYVFVDDVVSAFLAALETPVVGVFNVATGVGHNTHRVYDLVARAVGTQIVPLPRPQVRDAIKSVILKSRKAKRELGWKARTKFAKGVRLTVDWYKQRL